MRYHCLFEQSGTFKNVLRGYGHEAYDYDIKNEFGETDYVRDLFNDIDLEYQKLQNKYCKYHTIFDKMNKDEDFIIAFFPCTHFCDANSLQYRRFRGGSRLPYDKQTVNILIERNQKRAKFFEFYLKFIYICQELGISTIIENPATGKTYLQMFSPIDVAYHEKDRSLFGDDFKKPTDYFAINFEMKEKFTMFYDKNSNPKNMLRTTRGGTERSMITPVYAKNFYKRFLER